MSTKDETEYEASRRNWIDAMLRDPRCAIVSLVRYCAERGYRLELRTGEESVDELCPATTDPRTTPNRKDRTMHNRIALTARLRELEAEAHTERGNRDAELERVKWLEGEVSDSRLKAAQHGDALRDAEYDADLIRRALQVSPDSELDAVWSALRSNRITAPDSSLPPSDADPATGIPYGELT